MLIIETKTKEIKNPDTKTTYLKDSIEKSLLTERQFNLTVNNDTLRWFRRLGGSETALKSYTCFGYNVYKLISTSPDRQNRTIREFQFYSFDYQQGQIFDKLFKEFKNGFFYLKRFKEGKTLNEVKKIIKNKLS
ncbi:MAG: hypothetical protein GY740_23945 [Gammaproteobacteria bacterium]|nr:hypothetical protein [Gammaproteobacteria bacterium]